MTTNNDIDNNIVSRLATTTTYESEVSALIKLIPILHRWHRLGKYQSVTVKQMELTNIINRLHAWADPENTSWSIDQARVTCHTTRELGAIEYKISKGPYTRNGDRKRKSQWVPERYAITLFPKQLAQYLTNLRLTNNKAWKRIEEAGSLAIRLNENNCKGCLQCRTSTLQQIATELEDLIMTAADQITHRHERATAGDKMMDIIQRRRRNTTEQPQDYIRRRCNISDTSSSTSPADL